MSSHASLSGTELIWEGKYDAQGQRRTPQITPPELIPVERWDGPQPGERNRLILGDNLLVAAGLLEELRGKVTLIYIDPPYDVGTDFTMNIPVGETGLSLERVAYRDVWGRGADSYLHRMYERLSLMKELLSEEGTLYLHVDYRTQPALRLMLDELFGPEHFMNEIIWSYKTGGIPEAYGFSRKHDTILVYRKGDRPVFNDIRQKSYARTLPEPHTPSGKRLGILRDETCDLCGSGQPGQKYRYVRCRDVWDDINSIFRNDDQATGFATQKPEALLERIIAASSREGDIVADFFCGSGTTGTVAERMGRRWVLSDLGRPAIQTARKRLLPLRQRGFDLYTLGPAEQQRWLCERLQGSETAYREEILRAYGREAALVDGVEGLLTAEKLRDIPPGATCLAWDFEPGLKASQHLVRIPREMMEANRSAALPFAERAELEAEVRDGEIHLLRFRPGFSRIGPREREALEQATGEAGLDYIDFWAIDFDWQPGEPFRAGWYDARTRRKRTLETRAPLPAGGSRVALKVIDIFGEETLLPLMDTLNGITTQ